MDCAQGWGTTGEMPHLAGQVHGYAATGTRREGEMMAFGKRSMPSNLPRRNSAPSRPSLGDQKVVLWSCNTTGGTFYFCRSCHDGALRRVQPPEAGRSRYAQPPCCQCPRGCFIQQAHPQEVGHRVRECCGDMLWARQRALHPSPCQGDAHAASQPRHGHTQPSPTSEPTIVARATLWRRTRLVYRGTCYSMAAHGRTGLLSQSCVCVSRAKPEGRCRPRRRTPPHCTRQGGAYYRGPVGSARQVVGGHPGGVFRNTCPPEWGPTSPPPRGGGGGLAASRVPAEVVGVASTSARRLACRSIALWPAQ